MKMRVCFRCSRRRPLRKMLPWSPGEPPLCSDDALCWRAHHRDEAKVCRWILSEHNEKDRPTWRVWLAYHDARAHGLRALVRP